MPTSDVYTELVVTYLDIERMKSLFRGYRREYPQGTIQKYVTKLKEIAEKNRLDEYTIANITASLKHIVQGYQELADMTRHYPEIRDLAKGISI